MSEPVEYSVPWKQILGLTPHIAKGTRMRLGDFCAGVFEQINPRPTIYGLENLPDSPRFVVAANHYQRKGLWILHPAAIITHTFREHYGLKDPAVRWIVTANWPEWRVGKWTIPSPGDWLLPKVAHALYCFAVPFAGRNPSRTAASLRNLLREARTGASPIGLFPEGVAGTAGTLTEPLPGVGRLLRHLAKMGYLIVPVGIREEDRLIFQVGPPLGAAELLAAPQPARLTMQAIGRQMAAQSHSSWIGP